MSQPIFSSFWLFVLTLIYVFNVFTLHDVSEKHYTLCYLLGWFLLVNDACIFTPTSYRFAKEVVFFPPLDMLFGA
jgi:hypothetical protein